MEEYFHLIDDYLQNQLSADQKAAFERALQQDAALNRETTLRKAELDAMERLIASDLRDQMRALEQATPYTARRSPRRWWMLALAAALLTGWWFLSRPAKPKQPEVPPVQHQQIIPVVPEVVAPPDAKTTPAPKQEQSTPKKEVNPPKPIPIAAILQLAPPVGVETLVRGDDKATDSFDKACAAYRNGNWYEALAQLSTDIPDKTAEVHWLKGNIYFRQQRFAAAAAEFRLLTQLKTDLFIDRDQWMYLLSIAAEKGIKTPEAQVILQQMDRDAGNEFSGSAKNLRMLFE